LGKVGNFASSAAPIKPRLDHVAQGIHAFVPAIEVGKTSATALGDMDLVDRGGGGRQRIPQAQGLKNSLGTLGKGQGAVVVAGMCASGQRRGFDQGDTQSLTSERAPQAGADHAAADDQYIVIVWLISGKQR
jgi:hypothetical protein